MSQFKATALAVLVASSSVVFAGAMGPICAPGNVTVPCVQNAWDFGAKALYLQSNMGALNFPDHTPDTTGVGQWENLGNIWDWGFMIEGSHHFGMGSDVNLNWYHINDSRTVNQPYVVRFAVVGVLSNGPTEITTKPSWDAVNLEFGQRVDYSQHISVRFHGGVEYARVNVVRDYATFLTSVYSIGTRTLVFNGFGPRAGADASYHFNNGLGVYVNTAVGLYVGTSSFKLYANAPTFSSSTVGHTGSATDVVPELEAKIGANYSFTIPLGDVRLDAGWMWVNYFDALLYAEHDLVHEQNFSLQGPYVGFKWTGNLV